MSKKKRIYILISVILVLALIAAGIAILMMLKDRPQKSTRFPVRKEDADGTSDLDDKVVETETDTQEAQGSATVTLVTADDQGVYISMTFDAVDDQIQTITQVSKLDISGYDADSIAEVKISCDKAAKSFEEISGADYRYEQTEDELVETITLDTSSKDNMDEIRAAGLLPVEGSGDFLSLNETIISLKTQGWIEE